MVPSARSGEPATPGIAGGVPIISGPATAATGRAPGDGSLDTGPHAATPAHGRRRWSRAATAVDVSLLAPITAISGLFDREPVTDGSFEVEGLRIHYEDY